MLRNITKRIFGLVIAAVVSFGLIVDSVVAGETETKEGFVKTLVANSPWDVTWEMLQRSGTQQMSFFFDERGELDGKLFNLSSGRNDGAMKEIVLQDGRVSFIFTVTGARFSYRLTKDGLLIGAFEGLNWHGNPYSGTIVATPASGAKN